MIRPLLVRLGWAEPKEKIDAGGGGEGKGAGAGGAGQQLERKGDSLQNQGSEMDAEELTLR